jgi:hypothetical protein
MLSSEMSVFNELCAIFREKFFRGPGLQLAWGREGLVCGRQGRSWDELSVISDFLQSNVALGRLYSGSPACRSAPAIFSR